VSEVVEARRTLTISNRLGLHARPAAKLVQTASRFECDIKIRRGDLTVDGKSIMGVLFLGAALGVEIEIEARGPDAAEALDALAALVNGKFGEVE
jgi:phosphocarrier protein HPr